MKIKSANILRLCYNHGEKSERMIFMKKILHIKLYRKERLEKEYKSIIALEKNNTLTFFIDKIKTTITKEELIRENEEFTFKINFLKNECTYYLKENHMLFDIKVLEKSFYKQEEKSIIIKYFIETDEEPLKIEITWKEE